MSRLTRLALLVFLCLLGGTMTSHAMTLFAAINKAIGVEKLDELRKVIPLLNEVDAASVRYLEIKEVKIELVRVEDDRFCNKRHCLNIIVRSAPNEPQVLMVASKDLVALAPSYSRFGDSGIVLSFVTEDDTPGINVFVGDRRLVVIP